MENIRKLIEEIRVVANFIRKRSGFIGSSTRLLQLLQHTGAETVPQLARVGGCSRQNVQLIVNRLTKAGHLELRPNPAHKRSDLLRLTESGETLLASMAEQESRLLAELSPGISESNAGLTLALLRRLRESLSGIDGTPKTFDSVPLQESSSGKGRWRESVGSSGQTGQESESEGEAFPVSLL